mgnify:CR=1 FL=1
MNEDYLRTIDGIIKTGHWITDQVSKELKEFDITEPQYNVLRTLKNAEHHPSTVQEILEQMIQNSSNVSRIVDKLLSKGLVNRETCPSNRRKMDITITKAGLAILVKLDKKVHQLHEPMYIRLDSDELKTLEKLITKLTANNHE